jgi:glycerol-3-phosphate dehydrogenase (NAD(P)+)
MKVGILGEGRWGQALARLVLAAGNEPYIAYKGKKPPHVLPSTKNAEDVSAQCDLLLVATSAAEFRNAIRLAKPGPGNRVVVAGRGLEPVTGTWLADVVQQESDAVRVGALAGPAPVEEILNGSLCAGVIASPYEEVRTLCTEALHSRQYRVYTSEDLAGVQLAGAIVPVLAAMTGLAMTLGGAGVGMHAMVLSRGLAEASRLARAVRADPATFMGLAGVGDLVAAQSRPGHPHFDAGAALSRGQKGGPIAGARALSGLARRHWVELPLTDAMVAIHDGEDPLEVVQRLMLRRAQVEKL